MPTAQPSPVTTSELRQLQSRLAETRARLMGTQAGTGLAAAASVLIGVFAAEMTLDWLVHLPWVARACLSLPALGGAAWILYREVALPLWRRPGDHAVACAIERAMPMFQTRLIASIQLAGGKSALVGALVRETAAMAAGADFRNVVRTGKLVRALRLLACVLVVAGGLGWWGMGNVTLLLERALLLTTRLPSRTRIEHIECATRLAAGEDLKIGVQAAGVLPEGGLVVTRAGSGRGEYKLEREGPDRYGAVIRSVPESLSFRVLLNDATSDPVAVTVFSPPAVLKVACVEVFPPYTKLPPAPRPAGDLSLLAGSVLRLSVTASGPVKEGTVHLAGLEKNIALRMDAPDVAHAEIPVPKEGLTGFSIRLADGNGIASRETTVYRINIVPDQPPTIKITRPGPDEVATAAATEVVAFEAEDDFGVAMVLLHYMVNNAPEKVIDFDLAGGTPRRIERRFEWSLASLKLAPGGIIEYWMEAVDANDVTGPGKGLTGHTRIKIVTPEEKRSELAARLDGTLGALEGVTQSEDALSGRLAPRIFAKPQP